MGTRQQVLNRPWGKGRQQLRREPLDSSRPNGSAAAVLAACSVGGWTLIRQKCAVGPRPNVTEGTRSRSDGGLDLIPTIKPRPPISCRRGSQFKSKARQSRDQRRRPVRVDNWVRAPSTGESEFEGSLWLHTGEHLRARGLGLKSQFQQALLSFETA